MKNLVGVVIVLSLVGGMVSCGAEEQEEKAPVGVDQKTPEYKAYDLVQNLQIVKDLKASAEAKNQTISLQLSKDLLNGKNGYYWFQVVQHVGTAKLVKMNVKVRENTFKVTILDDDNGADLSPEEYEAKYPVK
ncbi:hypothetical protein [Fluviicola chungangensis]|uniref:Uncharacterized protein n=1 Tax=Fluviicola chungangensis TaxID=2597671 RepID=A0A556MRF3_9FLAO|nr:hypothetical protein [Fluviicola chungangensis]TSJ42510.1 hypothetical protein FO442_12145 [Fluviicola chungangensis]